MNHTIDKPGPTQNKKTVLFILSTNYAGSHFLSLLVGSHSKAQHIGEIHKFRKPQLKKNPCYICSDLSKCPVFGGLEPGKFEHIHEQVFSGLGDGKTLLADNSKKPAWANHFLENPAFEKKFVHLIRDPRALVRRFDLSFDTPQKRRHQRWKLMRWRPSLALNLLSATPRQLFLHKWLQQNQTITDFLRTNKLDHYLMTYRDLAKNTAGELTKLMPWLGYEFEPAQLEYWNVEHHGSQRSEYEWVKEKREKYFDTRWKNYLSIEEQEYCVDHPLVKDYLADLGVRVTDEGLTKG